MSGNTFGTLFTVTTFGESHGKALGCVIDGCPAGIEIDQEFINSEMARRRPGLGNIGTGRKENDDVKILSGVFEGKSTGTPIMMIVFNESPKSSDYDDIKDIFRPSHADYTYYKKYGIRDYRGGGRASGRETLCRVAAGSIAKLVLKKMNIKIISAVREVKGIRCSYFTPPFVPPLYTASKEHDEEIIKLIENTRNDGDSIGGVIETHISGCPAGLGEPVFDKLDATISHAVMSIGAVKGIEFGSGYRSTLLYGSQNNDQMDKEGFITNNAGGILGGISNGDEIIFSCFVKPTPSIYKEQKTLSIDNEERTIKIKGRHDPVILFRVLPVIEAMSAIALLDALLVAGCYE
ncbi:MAG TPA: chorismate synthase [Candidatus Ornithospirochaeta avicola]|uniref:Chorismate synthase n=1 Tax=Candidatus Ornithospirochaeta avicola TaxID=2840896 RepID=A0A9D1TMK6_9SPIO|nr:chorismate synthase [Candidatus Ornithospirochaeta avicola]